PRCWLLEIHVSLLFLHAPLLSFPSFFMDTAPSENNTLSLHDALPICLTVPRLTLMSLIKMMLVMVSVAAISKTFGLLRLLLRLRDRKSGSAGMPRPDLVCRLLLEKKNTASSYGPNDPRF